MASRPPLHRLISVLEDQMGPTIAQAITGIDPTSNSRLGMQVRIAHTAWLVTSTALGRDAAIEWYTTPNATLGGRTPIAAIRDLDLMALHAAALLVAERARTSLV